jgi:aryl-alcohol dehydrogenase-like predicted oxidoreductase
MIDPPSAQLDSPERKVELDQTVDFALQRLVEEAPLVGWTRVEFLTAVLDAAKSRLSAIEEERKLEADSP